MARLTGKSIGEIQSRRLESAREFAVEHDVVLVLKGAGTVIGLPDGRCLVNATGNPGMAKGGSGDLLAGMIASFLAQGMAPEKAAMCGVYLHGKAGDRAAKDLSEQAMPGAEYRTQGKNGRPLSFLKDSRRIRNTCLRHAPPPQENALHPCLQRWS